MDIDYIRQTAEAATPGPWFFGSFHRLLIVADSRNKHNPIADMGDTAFPYKGAQQYNDAAYIAAANPQVVIEMCDEIEALRKVAARYHWLRDQHWVDSEVTFRLGLSEGSEDSTSMYHKELDAAIDAKLL